MHTYYIVYMFAFLATLAVIAAVWTFYRESSGNTWEQRLQSLAAASSGNGGPAVSIVNGDMATEQKTGMVAIVCNAVQRFIDVKLLSTQAGMSISTMGLVLSCLGCGVAGFAGVLLAGRQVLLAPVVGLAAATLPLVFILHRRRRRIRRFAVQLPDALQMIARSLRAGISLPMSMRAIADEMLPPISEEFRTVSETVGLGIPLEQALADLVRRAPNNELRFFATAVTMQRETGGNLAEALDKIAGIVRERFKILGQVQALTGEGRISGVILMALPVVLFFTLYSLSEDYVMILFNDELGKRMICAAIVLQLLGAAVIKKIVDIDV